MKLEQLREQIDSIDDSIVDLFQQRMDIAASIAQCKREGGLPILQSAREREKLADITEKSRDDMASYLRVLYSLLFELSRTYQEKLHGANSALYGKISDAIANTPQLFPRHATVACQGVEGAYSQLACEKLFAAPSIQYFRNFEGVFSAIEAGFCRYGILPIENSTAGSVDKVYDLMIRHNFSIVRSTRLKVDHSLLAKSGTKLEDVREIFSHEQAISQCAGFLHTLKDVKLTRCDNTAAAAQLVALSERTDVAALSSRMCAELYGLSSLQVGVQDAHNNRTRFLCISKNTEIYPGADKTSVMMILPHKPGALYKVLARLYALGINLIKLESRPMPDRDFEFMFYLDLETSVYSEEFVQLMSEIGGICEEFKYLGSYTEVV
ncbi:MAG: chorismate mutase [Oscillospiraceae bacterium]|jgi:chorismate mutase/prephenate dehydratase|nr:chorismate mutase [Oscillospiraceae bacterium]